MKKESKRKKSIKMASGQGKSIALAGLLHDIGKFKQRASEERRRHEDRRFL